MIYQIYIFMIKAEVQPKFLGQVLSIVIFLLTSLEIDEGRETSPCTQ